MHPGPSTCAARYAKGCSISSRRSTPIACRVSVVKISARSWTRKTGLDHVIAATAGVRCEAIAVLDDSLQRIARTLWLIKPGPRVRLCLIANYCNLTLFQKTILPTLPALLFLAKNIAIMDVRKVLKDGLHRVNEDHGQQKIAYCYCF